MAWKDLQVEYVKDKSNHVDSGGGLLSCFSRFLAYEADGGWLGKYRLVINLHKVNIHLCNIGLRYEHLWDLG